MIQNCSGRHSSFLFAFKILCLILSQTYKSKVHSPGNQGLFSPTVSQHCCSWDLETTVLSCFKNDAAVQCRESTFLPLPFALFGPCLPPPAGFVSSFFLFLTSGPLLWHQLQVYLCGFLGGDVTWRRGGGCSLLATDKVYFQGFSFDTFHETMIQT